MSPNSDSLSNAPNAATATSAQGRERRYSLHLSLFLLVSACVVPAVLIAAFLAYTNYQLIKQNVEGDTLVLAQQVLADIERELAAIESGLRVLATSERLTTGDLAGFHRVARAALRSQVVYNYILTDAQGRQILNTLQPYGEPLPATGTPPQLEQVFSGAELVLTDLFIGPVTGKPAIAMGTPVRHMGKVAYSLNVGLDPARISDIVRRHALPQGWVVAILDSRGTIIGRSHDAQRHVGQPAVPALRESVLAHAHGTLETVTKDGVPVLTSHLRSATSQWTAVVGAPKAILEKRLYGLLTTLLLTSLLLALVGGGLAASLARRVTSSVKELNEAALALSRGDQVVLPSVQMKEADAVGNAILAASQLMADVHHRANHDSLTGLSNRELFDELVQFQLATAVREGGSFAILALDLDNFKQVNDSEGHAAGDTLLKSAASRIVATLRASDVAARLGGDEFAVLVAHADLASATDTARRLVEALRRPYPGVATRVSASIGIAIFPTHGATPAALLERADQALYEAKRLGKDGHAIS